MNRRRPVVSFRMDLTEQHRQEISRAGLEMSSGDAIFLDSPEQIMRLPGLLFDALTYCQDDEHFKRGASEESEIAALSV